jgi:hypothetical protein
MMICSWLLALTAHAADPPEIVAIRARWARVQEARGAGTLYPLSIDANPSNRMYAAIGTYQNTVTCYRSTNPEEPYPRDHPDLVTVKYEVAARAYQSSYLYDDEGSLLFAFYEGEDSVQWRVYWHGDALLRIQRGDTVIPSSPQPSQAPALRDSGQGLASMCAGLSQREADWRALPEP